MTEKKKFERLPTTVKPSVYDLFFKPDLKTFKFDGKETVHLQVRHAILIFMRNLKVLVTLSRNCPIVAFLKTSFHVLNFAGKCKQTVMLGVSSSESILIIIEK